MNNSTNECWCDQGQIEDPDFRRFNLVLILVILPFIAITGLICNVISVIVYTRHPLRTWSVNRYLAALAVADMSVDFCGIFVIFADSARGMSSVLQYIYVRLLPYVVPIMVSVQTISIYLTVSAAFDCFISVCTTHYLRERICRIKFANRVIACVFLFGISYNSFAFFELERVTCFDAEKAEFRFEVCPTELRMHPTYMDVYKVYMPIIVMGFLPFIILATLNFWIVLTVFRLQRSHQISSNQDVPASDSTTMLVMVVILFLCCNFVSIMVGVMEKAVPDYFKWSPRHYFIDLGNFLVVFNSSSNFFIYVAFSHSFRKILYRIFCTSNCRNKERRNNGTSVLESETGKVTQLCNGNTSIVLKDGNSYQPQATIHPNCYSFVHVDAANELFVSEMTPMVHRAKPYLRKEDSRAKAPLVRLTSL